MVQCNSEKIVQSRQSFKEILNKSDRELLDIIKDFMIKNNIYTSKSYRYAKFITFPTIKRRFKLKTWDELMNLLELSSEHKEAVKRHKKVIIPPSFEKVVVTESNDELLEMYKEFSEKIGATNGASMKQLKTHGFKYSETVLLRRFGNWKTVKERCGYSFRLGPKYTLEEIQRILLEERNKFGRRLSQREITNNPNLPALETIFKVFKTSSISKIWDELERGMEKTTTEKIYTKEEVKESLYQEYLKKGKTLTILEIVALCKEKRLPSANAIYRCFGTRKILEVWDIFLKEIAEEKKANENN
ncbi:MAG: hypothetical protein RSB33_06560 [Cetobacterium sp.]